jgi:hypothetical protein
MVNVMRVTTILSRRFPRLVPLCGCLVPLFGCLGAAVTGISLDQALAQQPSPNSHFDQCRAIADDAARLRCFESAASKPTTQAAPRALGPGAGTWRLVRTKNPDGGKDAVSIMHAADVLKSDLDLAGLMLRCGDGGVDVLIVVVEPLPPRAHPTVTVSAAGERDDFYAAIVPPGLELLLPPQVRELVSGPWTRARELSVEIDPGTGDSVPKLIRGVVSLAGLGSALPVLTANCPAP